MEYSDYPVHAWSRSRHQMRRICPRKAVLCYREARLGADKESDKMHRLIHDLRRRIPLEQYLNRIFDETLRRMFYRQELPFTTPEKLASVLTCRFDRDLEQMLCGSAASDHKKLFIKDNGAYTEDEKKGKPMALELETTIGIPNDNPR